MRKLVSIVELDILEQLKKWKNFLLDLNQVQKIKVKKKQQKLNLIMMRMLKNLNMRKFRKFNKKLLNVSGLQLGNLWYIEFKLGIQIKQKVFYIFQKDYFNNTW